MNWRSNILVNGFVKLFWFISKGPKLTKGYLDRTSMLSSSNNLIVDTDVYSSESR